ncbi:hypothetical protein WK68_32335 [Burkholderia ubonensis]|nr:hypothetical protein WK68_32335 [Burkholderia ubonensis]
MFPLRGLDRQPEVALDRQSQTDAQALEVFGAERRIADSAPVATRKPSCRRAKLSAAIASTDMHLPSRDSSRV